MSEWLSQFVAGRREPETWTPKRVGEVMTEAVRWARFNAGQVGPAGIKGCMPAFNPTLEDHLDEGWGIPEVAGENEPDAARPVRRPATPEQITRFEAALHWPTLYLFPRHEGSARILGLWLRCKVHKRPFDAAIKARGTISRTNAYALRDRALSLISQGLDRDGMPL